MRNWRHGSPTGGIASRGAYTECKVTGCSGVPHARGLCDLHYRRFLATGSTELDPARGRPGESWILENRDYGGDDCLEWPFSTNPFGRGMVVFQGKRMTAPRAMCWAAHGAPQSRLMQAAHSCGNGHLGCMNPRHMRWATHMENVIDRAEHGRDRKGEEINTAKLTEKEVREIRKLRGSASCSRIAESYGVTKATVVKIMSRKTWAWLED